MGYMYVIGPCYICKQVFQFSAERVPSFNIEGVREPVCGSCMVSINEFRADNGLPPFPILDGAYDPDEVW